jgi:hypothetical protein
MAERSIGMTTGEGDGTAGGYDSDRMVNFWQKSLGNGILLSGNKFNVSGTGTANLTVATGACVNNGFFYENTTPLTLVLTGVANGTYFLVVRLNNTASAITVVRAEGTGASTTTVAARTCRLALVTTASYDTTTDIRIASALVTGGVLTSFSYIYRQVLAQTAQLPAQVYSYISAATTAVPTATATQFVANSSFNTDTRVLNLGSTAGNPSISIIEPGSYLWDIIVDWGTNTTGSRAVQIATAVTATPAETFQQSYTALSSLNPQTTGVRTRYVFTTYFPSPYTVENSCQVFLYQNSGASLNCSGHIKITRI